MLNNIVLNLNEDNKNSMNYKKPERTFFYARDNELLLGMFFACVLFIITSSRSSEIYLFFVE